jgi:hypothetical protein
MSAPRFAVREIGLYERDVRLRMPFRFGVVTLAGAPQAFVRARIRLADGREAEGAAGELLAPKWFDKDPALTDEDNFEQLRASLAQARKAYLAGPADTAFGHARANYVAGLVAGFGPALIDRALLDALCRALGASFYEALRANAAGIELEGCDADAFLGALGPAPSIAARHTVGLLDPITAGDVAERLGDGLPQTLEEVLARYGQRYFKLKLAGDTAADLERLGAIASVLDRIEGPYHATLDGNEQYDDVPGIAELWRRMNAEPRLARLASSVLFIEQPIKRASMLARDVTPLATEVPLIIDESDDSLEAFPRARALGYAGVSSKTCKGLYKSIINRARCETWNREEGGARYFMSAEDLTVQPGLALQQDLALASLLGLAHVERNGHHYVNGMAALPEAEQAAFLHAHPDLYERSQGAVRVAIRAGRMSIGSLGCAGYASAAAPDWASMRRLI